MATNWQTNITLSTLVIHPINMELGVHRAILYLALTEQKFNNVYTL